MGLLNGINLNSYNTGYSYPLFSWNNMNFSNFNYLFDFSFNKTKSIKSDLFNIDNTSSNISLLKSIGYDSTKGDRLAKIAKKNASGFSGNCATYVKRDIAAAGLGKYEYGHAFQCDDILRKNPNFKEISTVGLDLKTLPAGCVLVYERGVAGYSNKYGHIEITDGKGNAYSDGKTRNIGPGAKVFIPV